MDESGGEKREQTCVEKICVSTEWNLTTLLVRLILKVTLSERLAHRIFEAS